MYTNNYRKQSTFTAEQVAWIQRARHREHIEKLRRQTYENSDAEVETDFKDTKSTQNQETSGSAEESYVVAPIPGVVLNYCVDIGETVKSGDAIVLLEAMKMENSIPSPKHGTVKTLTFSPGDSVSKGDILAVIVPSKV